MPWLQGCKRAASHTSYPPKIPVDTICRTGKSDILFLYQYQFVRCPRHMIAIADSYENEYCY